MGTSDTRGSEPEPALNNTLVSVAVRVASSGRLCHNYHLHGNESWLGLTCRSSLYTTLNLSGLMWYESVIRYLEDNRFRGED